MPKYRVKAPDGKTYDVTAPDGASQEEVMAFAQKHYGGGAGSDTPAPVAAPEEPGFFEGIPRQFGADLRTVARGVASIPDIVVNPVVAGFNRLTEKPRTTADLIAGREPGRYFPEQGNVTQAVDYLADLAGLARNAPGQRTAALEGGASVLGSLGTGALLRPLGGIAGRVGEALTAQPALQVASGATGGAAAEGAREAGAGPVGQLAAGVAGGLAPGIASLPRAGARAATNPDLAPALEAAAARNIPIRPTATDSQMVDRLRGLPLTGAKGRYTEDVQKFNDAVAKTLGAPEGTATGKIIDAAKKVASSDYNQLTKTYELPLDQGTVRALVAYRNTKPELGGAEPAAAQAIDEFLNEAVALGKGAVPGDLFKKLDTQLNKVPFKSESYAGKRALQDFLRDKFKAGMTPEDAALWDDTNRRWGDIQDVQSLYKTGKPFDPRKLLNRVTAKKAGLNRQLAGTRGEMGTLATIGQNIHPPMMLPPGTTIPIGTLAAGSGYLVPSTAGPLAGLALLSNIAGRVADNSALTKFLIRPGRESARQAKAAASATGAAVGANSQRNNEED
ncbi:MAG TPA: hypothetical protein VFH85_07790 [Gammaproteobacteria bacterium]|nr:hypothetical protein [Gammaproteobacteria bacterium]